MEREEFAARVQDIREQLYRTAYGYLGNPHDSLEAVDEAVYQGFRARGKLRQPEFFTTWMTRILIRVCYRELRRRTRQQEAPVEEQGAEDYDGLPLREAIERLPEELRQVIVLRYFTGLTQVETAQALEIVVTRQRRALALLRVELEEDV